MLNRGIDGEAYKQWVARIKKWYRLCLLRSGEYSVIRVQSVNTQVTLFKIQAIPMRCVSICKGRILLPYFTPFYPFSSCSPPPTCAPHRSRPCFHYSFTHCHPAFISQIPLFQHEAATDFYCFAHFLFPSFIVFLLIHIFLPGQAFVY